MGARPHEHRAAPGEIGLARAAATDDQAAGREIGGLHDVDQGFDRHMRIVHIGKAGVDHIAEIMRRNIGRHADGDTAGAIDQEIGETRGQNHRLALAAVVVRLEIHRLLLDILEQGVSGFAHADFGITHGGGHIAVHRTIITLAVEQRQAHGEGLHQPHHGHIDRTIAMRVVFTDHLTDDTRRLAVGLVPGIAAFVHRMQDAAVHRLQAVAGIGQRARHDHAHGIIEVGTAHLVFDRDRRDILARRHATPVRGARVLRLRLVCGIGFAQEKCLLFAPVVGVWEGRRRASSVAGL